MDIEYLQALFLVAYTLTAEKLPFLSVYPALGLSRQEKD